MSTNATYGTDYIKKGIETIKSIPEKVYSAVFVKQRTDAPPAPPLTGVFGYPENRLDVNENYIISVRSSLLQRTIRALVQDNFTTSVSSTWRQPSIANIVKALVQESAQAITGVGIGSQFMTRRIWYGTTPMTLQMRMKFEAVDNAFNEVVIPCGSLQQLALPSTLKGLYQDDIHEYGSVLGYLLIVPPGPNPFYFEGRSAAAKWSSEKIWSGAGNFINTRRGDLITITLGSFMSFSSVIVTKVDITWGKKFNSMGYPISAVAVVTFESYEIYTKEDIHNEVFNYNPVSHNDESSLYKNNTGV